MKTKTRYAFRKFLLFGKFLLKRFELDSWKFNKEVQFINKNMNAKSKLITYNR